MRPAPDHPSPANPHYAEYDGSGQMLREYGWKPGSLWGTDPAYFSTRNQELETRNLYYYLTDHLGTPHSLIDSAGATVWSASYDTFGQATVHVGSVMANGVRQSRGGSDIENNLRFPGQYFDPESGLHYNFHRYYSPTTGRYNRIDPIKDSTNWYGYVANSPFRYYDPYGLYDFSTPGGWADFGRDYTRNAAIAGHGAMQAAIGIADALSGGVTGSIGTKDDARSAGNQSGNIIVAFLTWGALTHIIDILNEPCPEDTKPKPRGWNEDWDWRPGTHSPDEGWRWYDPKNGEWRYHEDSSHPPHWDYNPNNHPASPWENRPL